MIVNSENFRRGIAAAILKESIRRRATAAGVALSRIVKTPAVSHSATRRISPIRVAKPNTRRARYLRMKYAQETQVRQPSRPVVNEKPAPALALSLVPNLGTVAAAPNPLIRDAERRAAEASGSR